MGHYNQRTTKKSNISSISEPSDLLNILEINSVVLPSQTIQDYLIGKDKCDLMYRSHALGAA